MRLTWIALAPLALITLLVVMPVLNDDRSRKIEVYRAFAAHYGEGNVVNLANITTRFDASNEAVLMCAPSVLLTTAATRRFRTQTFTQGDFSASLARVVDPNIQTLVVGVHDPGRSIAATADIDEALQVAFNAGLLQVSDIGFDVTGQRALLTFSFSCGEVCGHAGTAMFERRGGQWVRSQQDCGHDRLS